MNQAHLAIGEKKFELSINLYKTILEKFLPNHLRTEMYLAKAFFVKGDYEASKSIILNLLARFPQHIPLKFNLALCLFQQAEKIFNQDVRRVYQTN
jgi:tetratricopeptide (TPR) repeat protein